MRDKFILIAAGGDRAKVHGMRFIQVLWLRYFNIGQVIIVAVGIRKLKTLKIRPSIKFMLVC